MAGYPISIILMKAAAPLRLFDVMRSTVQIDALFGFSHAFTRAGLLQRG
jgi:hypothetical protein